MSHPSWVCGLKHRISFISIMFTEVTPFVGVWIETQTIVKVCLKVSSHTLRGCVD